MAEVIDAYGSIHLPAMSVPKASEVLANELRERILSGAFPEGAGLPAERELVAQTRMSRTTVREALRILEVQGLVRIRAGRTGGAFVQRPGQDEMASAVDLIIRGQRFRLESLLETRKAIEPYCARLAARHRTDEDLTALEAAEKVLADPESDASEFLEANVDWHVAVARASHNEILAGLMVALSRAIYTQTADDADLTAEVREIALKAHAAISAAIRERDPDKAARRMERHVHTYAEDVLTQTVDREIEIR